MAITTDSGTVLLWESLEDLVTINSTILRMCGESMTKNVRGERCDNGATRCNWVIRIVNNHRVWNEFFDWRSWRILNRGVETTLESRVDYYVTMSGNRLVRYLRWPNELVMIIP